MPNPDADDYGYADFMAGIDAVVMGRNSFEKVLGFEGWHYEKKVFVVSATLREVPLELREKVEIISAPPAAVLAELKSRGFDNLYIDAAGLSRAFSQRISSTN